jgi:predicted O-linked N-acetylglucosamine transferase (SPINDLY family)
MKRIGVIPRLDRPRYLRLVSAADVLLDTLHYGAGANTVADAVASGTPMVTLPGRFQRGRWAAGALRCAQLHELVADSIEDYVEKAIRLAADEPYRRRVSLSLIDFGRCWFEDPRPAEELEELWLALITGAAAGGDSSWHSSR